MTDLINQININGQSTTFFNYVNQLEVGVATGFSYDWATFLTAHFGNDRTKWTQNGVNYGIRFPVAWETLTGSISANAGNGSTPTNARCVFNTGNGNLGCFSTNTASSTGNASITVAQLAEMGYGILNNQSLILAVSGSSANRNSMTWFYLGWLKDRQYTGATFPRGFVMAGFNTSATTAVRRTLENEAGTTTSLQTSNPTISCSIATPGANSTEIILRDSAAPNNYIGQLWNMIRMPSSCIVGKIYKNTGVDPDTGVVETGRLRFWMCVGSWGADKIGMRVYTDNIT